MLVYGQEGLLMRIEKAAAIPLIVHDPFFSIWSGADHLYDADPVHWSGKRQKIRGYLDFCGEQYCFLGDPEGLPVPEQREIHVSATATKYVFKAGDVDFTVCFTSPLLPDHPLLVSRPCTYIDIVLSGCKDNDNVRICMDFSEDIVSEYHDKMMYYRGSRNLQNGRLQYGCMGKEQQAPLSGSGDECTIDWGYLYLASSDREADICFLPEENVLRFTEEITCPGRECCSVLVGYDDLCSVNYFGQPTRAYWTKHYHSFPELLAAAAEDRETVLQKAKELDEKIESAAVTLIGVNYALLCDMCFRQVIGAHKLFTDEDGNIIFLSKENGSNGCAGTVDISYPSAPFFLLFGTQYVEGMLRPIFRFASSGVWKFDFAPHDVGRYPYAWGQVYGLRKNDADFHYSSECGSVFPPYWTFAADDEIYDIHEQMPVEESANMLILTACICKEKGNCDFAGQYMEILDKWCHYLICHGGDPEDQLCTDDFAGHQAHNVNLSAKSIMGIEAYAQILSGIGQTASSDKFHEIAMKRASQWEKMALSDDGTHYRMTFDNADSWSLKYNLIWDKYFESRLFSEEVFRKEICFYIEKAGKFGIPLDCRSTYAKSDWILWCAAYAETKEEMKKLADPVAEYLRNTPSRFPFSDWYDADTGRYYHFKARSVQGGIFFPLLMENRRFKDSGIKS